VNDSVDLNRPDAPIRPGQGRGMLLGFAALFFLPLIGAFWLYYIGGWRPAGSTNYGELISPVVTLTAPPLQTITGEPASPELFKEKWMFVHIASGDCDTDCRDALWMMRQTRLLLAQDMDRVQRVFIASEACCDTDFLAQEHAGLTVLQVTDEAGKQWLDSFPSKVEVEYIYIVDPLGNLMMRFDIQENPKGLLSDIEKLLKLSHIG
jgi:hypothetical protein